MGTDSTSRTLVRFIAVGDLLLCGSPEGTIHPRDSKLISPQVRSVLAECDLLFGNIEFTLAGDGGRVPTEPRVVGSPDFVGKVAAAGFGVLSLANNHAFDCCDGGFQQLRAALDGLGLRHFGAGMDLAEAEAAAIVEKNGLRLAFLGAVDQRSGPYRFAARGQWGVAPLDVERLARQVEDLRRQVHHVIISLHWGEERFLIPAPVQIEQAHALVDAGASIVLGHHPHVLQGLEHYRGAPIIYSLGNFVADEVYFSDGDAIRWNRTERTGCALLADLTESAVANVRQISTFDNGRLVELDRDGFGSRRITKASRAIAAGVTPARYRREQRWVKQILPILKHLRWSEIKRLRGRRFADVFRGLLRLLRGR
jgi:poly-gamma-glutamate capsule biosynthesis protein CapA/YwtB (metallophosphatase superfamily)